MSTFSALYKKTFRELLFPYGYKLRSSLFYKEVNRAQCFFIIAKKEKYYPKFTVYFGLLPYCMDMESELERICDIPDELEFELTNLMWELAPLIFNMETAESYYESRLYAESCDEDGTSDSLYNVSCDIKKYILPYFHQFDDLQYYYTQNSQHWNFADPVRYGLSLKLHKYEDALKCVEYRLSDHNRIMNHYLQMKKRLKFNKSNDEDNLIIKKIPDAMATVQGWIDECTREISEYEKVRDYLTENNITALDMIVAETEKRSRTHLRKLLGMHS